MLNLNISFRKSKNQDINSLLKIEDKCFTSDKISRRSFMAFITKSHDDLVVVEDKTKGVIGYGLVLYKKGSSLARLYSIAIDPIYKGQGLGQKLLLKLEEYAIKKRTAYLRLEVASQNKSAQALYEKLGYYKFNIKNDYYENHDSALCYEKILMKLPKRKLNKVNFYQQTTEFTCGAASLMMAMNALRPKSKCDQSLEIQIWREATTVFMLSGHGGCGPRGLALAAKRRGFQAEIYLSTKDFIFLNSVRDKKKKEIMKVVQENFQKQIKEEKIPIKTKRVRFELVSQIINDGGIPIVLISSYLLTGTKTPHWIVISGADENFLYFHDPYLDEGQSPYENQHIPIRRDEFNKISKYGSQQLQSIVVIKK